jgi:DNA repair protein RadD
MTTLRPYQSEAIEAVHAYWQDGGGNPLVELATGTGKSVVLGQICRDVVEAYDARVLVLTHVKELVEQDFRATMRLWPQCPAGINSAGLGRRETRAQVLFASIQSVHRLDEHSLGKRQLIIVDEAHLLPKTGDGMYLKLIDRLRSAEPDMRVLGLTATPYRLDSGRLDKGDNRIFDRIVYSYGIGEGVRDGYLSPLTARNSEGGQIDVSGVARRGGEFVDGALQAAASRPSLVVEACREIVAKGHDRRGWIVFCAGVEHASQVMDQLRSMGVAVACITGETPAHERDRTIKAFKAGQLRCLTSVGVLTTGFDAPHVDLIALLRPTLSTGLYVQMLGRGTRLADGKTNCLVLDFSGNVRRHGPVDAISVGDGKVKGDAREEAAVKPETVRAKACPECGSLVGLRVIECDDCGHVWPIENKHEAKADSNVSVMVREVEQEWHPVTAIRVRPHVSASTGNKTLRVDYSCGLETHSEWIGIGATGWGGERAALWWRLFVSANVPSSVDEAPVTLPVNVTAIRIRREGKYWRVANRMRADGSCVDEKLRLHKAANVIEGRAA